MSEMRDERSQAADAELVLRDLDADLSPAGHDPIPELDDYEDEGEGPRRGRRIGVRIVAGVLAATLIVALSIGGISALTFGQNTPPAVASATLDPAQGRGDASGRAVLEHSLAGGYQMRVTIEGAPVSEGYREVWLVSRDGATRVSLGRLDGESGVFTIPGGLTIREGDVVEVADGTANGDVTRPGAPLVGGALTATSRSIT
ncbi:hypothetical protein ACFSBZ_05890 [Amnibacterium flavum]|uniref:hypothetical protein n=1 Tax=Amnibacterium flavum TaxID=2173173 RepID=UPI003633C2A2